jgi:hypothetical protein
VPGGWPVSGWSADHAIGFGVHGWAGFAIAALAGAGGAALLLATSMASDSRLCHEESECTHQVPAPGCTWP